MATDWRIAYVLPCGPGSVIVRVGTEWQGLMALYEADVCSFFRRLIKVYVSGMPLRFAAVRTRAEQEERK
jgi:hypothetical protein